MLASFGIAARRGEWTMSIGAVVSIAGVYEVFTLGLARLSYAMAADGLFPPAFARLHSKTGTPYVGLLFQGVAAFVMALFLHVQSLIAVAVFFLGLCYLPTALAAFRLAARNPEQRLHLPGLRVLFLFAALAGFYLSSQVPRLLLVAGTIAMVAALLMYLVRSATWSLSAARMCDDARSKHDPEHWLEAREAWLLHFVRRSSARGQ
jgi:amino acid transporter